MKTFKNGAKKKVRREAHRLPRPIRPQTHQWLLSKSKWSKQWLKTHLLRQELMRQRKEAEVLKCALHRDQTAKEVALEAHAFWMNVRQSQEGPVAPEHVILGPSLTSWDCILHSDMDSKSFCGPTAVPLRTC